MARIPTVRPEKFDPRLAAMVGNPTNDDTVALGSLVAWAHHPELAMSFLNFQRVLVRTTSLSARLLELLRLRVSFHNQCRSCMATRSSAAVDEGLDEGAVCSLQKPAEASDLSEAEKAALAYADLLATDHLAISDQHFEELRKHFTELEIVELGVHLGICVGFGRLAATWDLIDELPEELQVDAEAAPWQTAGVLR